VSGLPEIGESENARAFFLRLIKHFEATFDPGGSIAFTKAAAWATVCVADRNEAVQRGMLGELRAIHTELVELNRILRAKEGM
jgi:hypothetical protein